MQLSSLQPMISRSMVRFGDVEDRNKQPGAIASAFLGPSGTSFWFGTYTPIPAPPPQARLQMSVEADSGDLFLNYLIWDHQNQCFKRQDVHYSASNGLFSTNRFQERGGYVQDVLDGEMLYGGVIVDQLNHRLLLPNGGIMFGPTGDIYDCQGRLIKRFREAETPPRQLQYTA